MHLVSLLLLLITLVPVSFFAASYSSSAATGNNSDSTQIPLFDSDSNQTKLNVVATFYPIYEFVKTIGGDKVIVSTLIPIGVEPHDFEPTIQQIQNAESADLVVYNGAGLENWIEKIKAKQKIDASQGVNLLHSNYTESVSTSDPHIWLDPVLAMKQIENIKNALIKVDPANSQYYEANADRFINELSSMDSKIKNDLASCNKKDFIAFHNAFTYFADRYGLKQHSIKGPSPEGEVLPQRLAEIISLAKDLDLHVIYSEDLIDPRSAETIAQEIPNGKVLILSPIEGIKSEEQKAGIGYLDKLNEDVSNLKIGLECPPR